MKLAVSQIAWTPEEDDAAHACLVENGVHRLEVVPARTNPAQRAGGLEIVAMQALCFGCDGAKVFGTEVERARCEEHLAGVVRSAAAVGALHLVFGAPAVRRVPPEMTEAEAETIAWPFFARLGALAAAAGVRFCLEPNPPAYGCNFLVNLAETARAVRQVASPGICLQLDAGALALNGEDPQRAVAEYFDLIGHVHISEAHLADFAAPWAGHRALAAALREAGYTGCVSIEMKRAARGLAAVREAIAFARESYGAA